MSKPKADKKKRVPAATPTSDGTVVSLPNTLLSAEGVGAEAFRLYVHAAITADLDGFILGGVEGVRKFDTDPEVAQAAMEELVAAGLVIRSGDLLERPTYHLTQAVDVPITTLVATVTRKLALYLDVTITDNVNQSLATFVNALPFAEVLDALEVTRQAANRKGMAPDAAFRYFCGVCWNKITKTTKTTKEGRRA